ncbi:helix-turn-helix domain-containing protein [Psychroflexus salinarum]|uniref:Helix-turn-helix domain-containing protein n=1 Tax=Psychroflexus salinarum TaxID=546024 RepID=A0ABW3GL32_9FLAO
MTKFAIKYFGKELDELNISDIEGFFLEEKEESDNIEFKSFHPKLSVVKKDTDSVIRGICALLNSNGGLLIWGAPHGIKEKETVIFKGELSPVNKKFDKDSLISKISDSITPLPVDVNVKTLKKDKGYVYVFEIQKSNYSPHQFKNTYFARLDGQTKPAPHYLIEALFNRVSYPNIEGYLNFNKFGSNGEHQFIDISIILVNFSKLINEYNVTARLICPQAVFKGGHGSLPQNYVMAGSEYTNQGNIKTLHYGAPHEDHQRLVFNLEKLGDEHNYEMDFILQFGGKKSPLKTSMYKLSFSGSIPTTNLATLIIQKEENILASDKEKQVGSNKENLLKHLLKR